MNHALSTHFHKTRFCGSLLCAPTQTRITLLRWCHDAAAKAEEMFVASRQHRVVNEMSVDKVGALNTRYFGYLHRNPNDAPDADFTGYNFWLNKLNPFGGNFLNPEMVKAFITSVEYRQRFDSCPGCWDY